MFRQTIAIALLENALEFWKPSIADASSGILFYTILPVHKRAFSQRLLLEFFVQNLFRTTLNSM